MFYIGFFFGVLCMLLHSAIKAYVPSPLPLTQSLEGIKQTVLKHRKTKNKPKAISEIEEWKKEQNEPPKDPGFS